ncbi:chitin synthase chs-2-like [Ruditapes philippinarum]|uniref:chitin synthase chs-2-like n=1 Tax=Ruditapes philippinarum TaxID=129788 RepID=UPI00295B8459|nr:chitin synthase chs-2-like [Ruditapes philippinarum]
MAYPTLSLYWALAINLLPVGIFILLCYVAKGDTQLAYAAVLSTVYSLVMMLVIVGLLKQAADNGFCSVTTLFLCFVAGVFILAAFIHPQEFWCLLHGFLYFLAIPSMSMLLMLYSIGNLHVVSWGTRETPKPAAAPKPGEVKKQPEKKGAVQEWLQKLGLAEKAGKSDYMFSFGNLCRCVCCPSETKDTEDIKLRAILDRLDDMEARIIDSPESHQSTELESERHVHFSEASDLFEGSRERINPLFEEESTSNKPPPRHWINDKELMMGAVETIPEKETTFWHELIKTYLYPLEGDKKEQEKTQAELLELRNTVCLFFLLVNALFVVIVFSLQQVNADSGGSISIELPCANGNFGEAIEPISMAFTAVFGLLLLIQLFCMILHRMSTFLQICSITEIKLRRPKQLQAEEKEISVEKGLRLVRDMQGIKDDDTKSVVSEDLSISDDRSSVGTVEGEGKRDLWKKIANRRREQKFGTLSQNFVKNFKKLQKHMEDHEMGSTLHVNRGVGSVNGGLGAVTEEDDQEDVQQLRSVKRKFNRFERKSIFTIVQMSRDPRLKQSILQRGNVVTSRWRRAALKAKLRAAAEQAANNGNKDTPDGKPKTKVSILDITRLAVADRDSNVPSPSESDDELVDQKSRL